MIGNSTVEYIGIRLSILALRLVTPLCFGYVAWLVAVPELRERPVFVVVLVYAAMECAFYLLVYLPRSWRLQAPAQHPPLIPREAREALFEKCHTNIPDVETYMQTWFLGAPSWKLKRDNVVDWILWAVFNTNRADLEWSEELEGCVRTIETMLGRKLEPGRNKDLKSITLTLDPVVMLHRPLIWYMIVMLVDTITSLRLLRIGFSHYTTPQWFTIFPPRPLTLFSRHTSHGMSYWMRPHSSKTKLPIVFLHGIGIGLWPYIHFCQELIALEPDVGIILVEILPICMRITRPVPSSTALCTAISGILQEHELSRVCLMAHSYGSVITSHLLHSPARDLIASTVLVDPVALLLHLPDTAYNFVYRTPHQAAEHQLWYFASRDSGVAHALSRHFFWGENILWQEDLPARACVSLSEGDQIMPSRHVWKYMTGSNVDEKEPFMLESRKDARTVLFYKGIDHAQVFERRARRAPLIAAIQGLIISDVGDGSSTSP